MSAGYNGGHKGEASRHSPSHAQGAHTERRLAGDALELREGDGDGASSFANGTCPIRRGSH